MKRLRHPLTALLVFAASAAAAQSLDLNQGGPVDITASNGIEWRQQDQVVIARGDARAVRGNVTVTADRLIARYRQKGGPQARPNPAAPGVAPGAREAARPAQAAGAESPLSGGEIWRLEAEGRVRVASETEHAEGERAVYDMDQAVMVMSGQGLSLTMPDQRITARDSLEYWPQRRMAVARGGALVVTSDDRRISADTLVAYFLEAPAAGAAARPPTPPPTSAARPPIAGLPSANGNSRVDRVEAYGSVEIRTAEEVIRGERGLYSPQTGMARLVGGVRITRGDNQLNGQEAIVNLRTGVSRLVSAPGTRVQGLIVPGQQNSGQQPSGQQQPGQAVVPQVPRPAQRRTTPPPPREAPGR